MIGRPEMRNCHRCGAGPFEIYIHRCGQCQRLLLSARDLEYVELIMHGYQNKEIAYKLGNKEGTVKVHLSRLFDKVGVYNRTELAMLAVQMGLARTEPVIPNGTVTHPQA